MAQDIFQREVEYGGAFSADLVKMSFGKLANGKGALVQNVQVNYSQQVTRLYELGSGMFYYVGGRSSGQASLAKVLGPNNIIDEFISLYGNICSPQALAFSFTQGCDKNSATKSYNCGDCVLTGVGFSVAAQDTVVSQACQMMIGWMSQ